MILTWFMVGISARTLSPLRQTSTSKSGIWAPGTSTFRLIFVCIDLPASMFSRATLARSTIRGSRSSSWATAGSTDAANQTAAVSATSMLIRFMCSLL